ncbi:hypothetical protein BTO20_29270 [Mycobacterium dioxanotrophicus]|uniref:Uncharacterized protein n=1 Tax=Mycobacterium dioxanotrophicus TaxID=482462 RepID=A0A1Y0CAU6_9MYCO|nr:hypothetical protein BTO20_29270 [Mycobacterium dioxanotrophicus]
MATSPGSVPGATLAGVGFACGLTVGGVKAGTGASFGAVNPGATFDGGAAGAGAVNAGGAKDVWWLAVGVASSFSAVDGGSDVTEVLIRGLSSLVKSRADLFARSFISVPDVVVTLSLEMNCVSEAFRLTTGADAWMLTLVTELTALITGAVGAQSRLRGLCQSRFMFQFWYRYGLNPCSWSH